MLRQIRGATRGWVSGVILFILAGCFVLFLGSGNNTIFDAFLHPVGANDVASVGGQSITPRQLDREIDLTVRRLRSNGQQVSRKDIVDRGLHLRLLETLIERRALAALTASLGVTPSDKQVANAIRDTHIADNPLTGSFDRGQYLQFLSQVQYSQPEFEREQRNDIAAGMLMDALTTGTRAPSSFGALALAYDSERRTISIAQAPPTLAGAIAPPTDAQLLDFYHQYTEALRTPEYRTLTLVFARPADFAARITVPEERVRQEFNARAAALTRPEKRSFVQISAPDQARAQQAATRMAHGEAPDAVAHSLGLQVVNVTDQPRTGLADANIADAVFAMANGAAPAAVRATLSPWAAVKLQSITAAVAPNYDEQKDALRTAIANSEAADALNDAMGGFDTARAGGASVADAAQANHLTVVQVPAVDARGLTPQGQPAEGLVDQDKLVQAAFATNEGEASEFTPLGDGGYALLTVTHIRPASVRPLAEVHDQLIQVWTARQRAQRLQAIGDQVKEAVAQGQNFATAAQAHHLQVTTRSQQLDRQMAERLQQFGGEIFSASAGDVVVFIRPDNGFLAVGIVEDITHADPAQMPQVVEQNRDQMQRQIAQSMVEVIASEAVTRGKPRRNEAVLQQQFAPSDQNAQQ
ncbi:MAG: peptidylprolyl isomerase [Pseudomonadota bacterium]